MIITFYIKNLFANSYIKKYCMKLHHFVSFSDINYQQIMYKTITALIILLY